MNFHFWLLLCAVALIAGLSWGVSQRGPTAAASVLVLILAFFPGSALTALALVPAFGAAWAYGRFRTPPSGGLGKPGAGLVAASAILGILWFVLVLPDSGTTFPMLPSDTGRASPSSGDFIQEMKDHPEGILFLIGMAGALVAGFGRRLGAGKIL